MKIELKKETLSGVFRGIQGYPGVSRVFSRYFSLLWLWELDKFKFKFLLLLLFPKSSRSSVLRILQKRQGFRLLRDSTAGILALDSLAT